jgi:hypothetical protein
MSTEYIWLARLNYLRPIFGFVSQSLDKCPEAVTSHYNRSLVLLIKF